MAGGASGEQVLAAAYLVLEFDHTAVGASDGGVDGDFFVVAGRSEVAALGAGDGEVEAGFEFQVAVDDAGGAAIFGAADFHPNEIVGVIDEAHLVGFGVAHAEARFVSGHAGAIIARRAVGAWRMAGGMLGRNGRWTGRH